MNLDELKRWHWMLIGLLFGALWSGTRLFYGQDYEARSFAFDHAVLATKDQPMEGGPDEGYVYLTDLHVHPPAADDTPEGRNRAATQSAAPLVQWVTGLVHHDGAPPPWYKAKPKSSLAEPQAFAVKVPVPFHVGGSRDDFVLNNAFRRRAKGGYELTKSVAGYKSTSNGSYPSVAAYLDELNRKYGSGTVKYRYNWWETRWAVMTVYPIGGIVAIGVIWPTVLQFLIGAGFGGKSKKEEQYDLSRFKGTSRPAVVKKPTGMTDADHAQLAAMNDELEKDLLSTARPSSGAHATAQADTAVRQLDAGAPQSTKPAETPAAAKAFGAGGADYYPTEIHHDTPPQK